ncbi:hypothetical protein H4R18_002141 [Coemansia javaensis]|uniref:AN1-type domain-containing protein n=1 Tax=Coemansia javaensis TaxID=2761396 RepID=A0A9W8HCT1_9FUNG|nr:hypothetical protein H4R18_002141 [Coemansia javaensis]
MEFPDLGVQCHRADCGELDFLPFRCGYCEQKFCEAHWKVDAHQCPRRDRVVDRRVPNCPICQEIVSLGANEDPDTAVDRHIRLGCRRGAAKDQRKPAKKPNGCTFRRCAQKPLVIDVCSGCTQRFCIRHLHADVHDCKGPPRTQAAAAAASPLGGGDMLSIFAGKRTNPTPTPAAKAALGSKRPPPAPRRPKPKLKPDTGCICA